MDGWMGGWMVGEAAGEEQGEYAYESDPPLRRKKHNCEESTGLISTMKGRRDSNQRKRDE